MVSNSFVQKIKLISNLKLLFVYAVVLFCFLVLFTPFSFWLASPLNVQSSIQKGDCLLVLSGGSYPNGELSSFSLERTVQAIKLYRNEMSSKIIFSGGGERKDAFSMKALAVLLGVKKEDILLEGNSRSTYENFLYSSKILSENNCSKVLLVTSPIHLKRSMIIAKNISPNVSFIPASFSSYDQYRSHPLDRLVLFWFTTREYAGLIVEYFRK